MAKSVELLRSDCLFGLDIIERKKVKDSRGEFVKLYQESLDISFIFFDGIKEEYYSKSHKNSFRGLHFQNPPMEHVKYVTCIFGEAIDYIVDLRKDSPTFLRYFEKKISHEKSEIIKIPAGCAHGFLSLMDDTIINYKVTSEYSTTHDAGIHFSCLEIQKDKLIISKRDNSLLSLSEFLDINQFKV